MRKVWPLLLIMTLIGGATPIAARMAVREIPHTFAAWLRFGGAGALLWLTLRARGVRLPFTRRDLWPLLGVALLCVPINQAGFLGGIKLANASHAALFYAMTPVLVFWLTVARKQAAFDRRMLFAAGLAFAGAALVLLPALRWSSELGGGADTIFAGDLLLLLAVVSWAAFIVFSKPIIQRRGALPTLTVVFLLGALLQTPLALSGLQQFDWSRLTWRGLAGFAFITLVSSYAGYLLTYFVLANHDATRAMVFVNGQFLLTILLELWIFGVPLTVWFFAGGALILVALAIDIAHDVADATKLRKRVPNVETGNPAESSAARKPMPEV